MRYPEQIEAIKSLNIPIGISKRITCPACGGHNTLGVANRSGKLTWHCFRASCGIKGKADTTMTLSDLKAYKVDAQPSKFILPEYLTYVSNPVALSWLSRYNCTKAVSKGQAKVRYDPRLNRLVWLVEDAEGTLVDAVGRTLDNHRLKWLRYGSSGHPLVIGKGDIGIVCEDAASACSVASIGAGIALLGTNLTGASLSACKHYKRILIALDPDAKLKALKMHRQLSQYVDTRIVLLEDDPKMFDEMQLRDMMKEHLK